MEIAKPCNERGEFLLPNTRPQAPPISPEAAINPWTPFRSRVDFDFAHFHFIKAESSAPLINEALDLWAASVMEFGGDVPWENSKQLYATIDAIQQGDSPWKVYKIRYQGLRPPGAPPKWMTQTYEFCVRNTRRVLHHQFGTTQFKDSINYTPYQQFDGNNQRIWSNLMSADWAWTQAVRPSVTLDVHFTDMTKTKIAEDESTHGSMFVPIVIGSDKTTVSVATGHQEFHPVYMSPGNLTNIARRSRGNALLPVAFLPIPKSKSQL
jgi:hypothetical protein